MGGAGGRHQKQHPASQHIPALIQTLVGGAALLQTTQPQMPLTTLKSCRARARAQGRWAGPTSDDAEELFDAQAGVHAVEEPLHVATPAAQCGAGLRGRGPGRAVLQEHFAQPADHPLDPLLGEHRCVCGVGGARAQSDQEQRWGQAAPISILSTGPWAVPKATCMETRSTSKSAEGLVPRGRPRPTVITPLAPSTCISSSDVGHRAWAHLHLRRQTHTQNQPPWAAAQSIVRTFLSKSM